MSWDFCTEPEYQAKLDWARSFVEEHVWPLETLTWTLADLREAARPLQDEVKQRGLWAAHLSPDHGGQGLGQVALGLLHEILGTSPYAPFVFGCSAPDSGNAEILALVGSDEQKERWLEPLLHGEMLSCFALTEPGAGADPTMITTTAREDSESWVLSGHKWMATNASVADVILVVAVTDPEASRHQRASIFLVPSHAPGLDISRDIPTMEHPEESYGQYGNHAEVFLNEVSVGGDALLGPRGGGFQIAQARLGPGRIHHCMRWLGQASRAFDALCERAVSREAFGTLLAEKQTVQNWIADSAAELQAARLMTLHAAWKIDQVGTREARVDISLIKFYGAKVLHDIVDRALQIHGSLGYSTDLPLERMYRFARAARFYDGPDEVHRQTVAKLLLRDVEPPPDGIPSEHVPTRRAAAMQMYRAATATNERTANARG
jgi:acyl-CoA dehydrogenase